MGRRSFGPTIQEDFRDTMENFDILSSLSDSETNSLGCYSSFGFCLSSSVLMALNEETAAEKVIMGHVVKGMAEYFSSGDISSTWQDLREIDHVRKAANCLKQFSNCS